MQFHIVPMTAAYANTILAWTYDGPYSFYDYHKSASHLLDSAKWGRSIFAVLNEAGQLVGELTLGFLDPSGEWLSQAAVDAGELQDCVLWIGFGMRPDLTGRGLGLSFVQACSTFAVDFARQHCNYTGEYIGLNVYQFNQRAVKVYERAGFETYWEGSRIIDGVEFITQRMRKKI